MKAGIVGLPGSGKWTVFEALTRNVVDVARKGESRIGTIDVPDERVDALSAMYRPKKTTRAQVQYFLPGVRHAEDAPTREQGLYAQVRDCDALIAVVRNFNGPGREAATPLADVARLEEEMMFADLLTIEKRLERIAEDRRRNRKFDPQELDALEQGRTVLESEVPLRRRRELAGAPQMRSFSFLSAKPLLVLFNNGEGDLDLPDLDGRVAPEHCAALEGTLEHELAQIAEDEVEEFLAEYGIAESAMGRIIARTYALLGLISFFTVGPDEVRAWTVPAGTLAPRAAGAIHTDLERGFIRAQVVGYDDLMAAGDYQQARSRGMVRLEGKGYEVQDGDVLDIRFNV